MKNVISFSLSLAFALGAGSWFGAGLAGASSAPAPDQLQIRLAGEISLDSFGGVSFLADLDGDGSTEYLWLQSSGMFYSKVFTLPRFTGLKGESWIRRIASGDELAHYCLTATNRSGKVLWQIGKPWKAQRPFVTHQSERSVDAADIDGDGRVEVVVAMLDKLAIIDGKSGRIKKAVPFQADNITIVRLAHTGRGAKDWTILAKPADAGYPPHETANPAYFYNSDLTLIKTADYLGAGHAPLAMDIDGDGLDEFIIGFNLVDHNLSTVWTFEPVPKEKWSQEMHADGMTVGRIGKDLCIAYAASDTTFVVTADKGKLIWKKPSIHPQQTQVGRFLPGSNDNQVFVHNKRADLQLVDAQGREIWSVEPPANFPFGQTEATKKKFHMLDPTVKVSGVGPQGTDVLVFTDAGWPYVINGLGKRFAEFPHTKNINQNWGDVPSHRPDDYGYGFYVRVEPRSGKAGQRVLINDRRFAWMYELRRQGK